MKKYIVTLTNAEREELIDITKKGKHAASKILHARILLEADESSYNPLKKTDAEISKLVGVGLKMIQRVRQRLVEEGLESALCRRPRTQIKPVKIGGEEEAHLVAICCSSTPEGRSRWTLKLLAAKMIEMEVIESVSPATVGRALKKTRLSPGKRKNGVYLR